MGFPWWRRPEPLMPDRRRASTGLREGGVLRTARRAVYAEVPAIASVFSLRPSPEFRVGPSPEFRFFLVLGLGPELVIGLGPELVIGLGPEFARTPASPSFRRQERANGTTRARRQEDGELERRRAPPRTERRLQGRRPAQARRSER